MEKKLKKEKKQKNLKYKSVKNLWRTVKFIYTENPKAAITAEGCYFLQTVLELYTIGIGGKLIDSVELALRNWDTFTIRRFFFSDIFWFLALSVLSWIGVHTLQQIRGHSYDIIERRFNRKSELAINQKIANENLEEVEDPRFQHLLDFVLRNARWHLHEGYENIFRIVRHTVKIIGILIILYNYVGLYTIIPILVAIAEPWSGYIGNKKIEKYLDKTTKRVRLIEYIQSVLRDVLVFAEIKVMGVYEYLYEMINTYGGKQDDGGLAKAKHNLVVQTMFATLGQVFMHIYTVFLVAMAVILKFTIGQFKMMYDYAFTLYHSSYTFLFRFFELLNHMLYINKFFEFIDYEGFGDHSYGMQKLGKGTPKLQFDNLDFQYPGEKEKALENINFTIKPGEKVLFLGSSGSGKTSLLKLLCGLYKITAGDYVIGTYSIRELARSELKQKISLMTQDFIRYNFSVKDNIVVTSEKINKTRYEEIKKICMINEFLEDEGIDDNQILGKQFGKGRNVSPDYWQRIAFARMLYRKAQIYIADEPFTYIASGLYKALLKQVIDFLGSDKTLIIIEQQGENLDLFDRVYRLKKGKLV